MGAVRKSGAQYARLRTNHHGAGQVAALDAAVHEETFAALDPALRGVFGCVDVPAPRAHALSWQRGAQCRCVGGASGRWRPKLAARGRGGSAESLSPTPLPLLLRCAGTGGTRQHASCLPLHCPPGSPPQKQNCPATAHASAPGHWRCLSRRSARPVRAGPQPPAERAAWLRQPLATLARLAARRPALERAGLCPVSPQALASAADSS